MWTSCDRAGQFWNPYGYASNPILCVDNDGNFFFIPILIGLAVGAYLGGSMTNESLDPTTWDWRDSKTYVGMGFGAVAGAMGGYVIGGALAGAGTAAISMSAAYGSSAGAIGLGVGLTLSNQNKSSPNLTGTESPDKENFNPGSIAADGQTGTGGGNGLQLAMPDLSTCQSVYGEYAQAGANDASSYADQFGGGYASSGGMDILRSPRFNSDGSIALNPRGLLGSFGVPISGGIIGAGLLATGATAAAIEYGPEVAATAWRHRVAIERATDKYMIGPLSPKVPIPGTPFSLGRNLPGTAAGFIRVGVPLLFNGFSGGGETIVPASYPFAPDATSVYP